MSDLSFYFVLILLLLSSIGLALLYFQASKQLAEVKSEIQALKRHRTDFIANLSHELKTPLTSIKGYTESLRDGAVNNPERADLFLQKIEDNVERLDLLTHDILDLSRLEATDEHLKLEAFEVSELLAGIQDQFSHRLEQKSQMLKIENELGKISLDSRLLDQALSNLVLNAHRYCPEAAIIEIRAKLSSLAGRSYYLFEVRDNGPGIAEADLPRIFERFYRADKSRNRASGGTGLGLAIVKHIVLSHGGQVKAQNLPTGGMNFSLLFPVS